VVELFERGILESGRRVGLAHLTRLPLYRHREVRAVTRLCDDPPMRPGLVGVRRESLIRVEVLIALDREP
jgi:hypothetical protein